MTVGENLGPDPFISPPYTNCPNCGRSESFGVLMVNHRNYLRRCHQCRHTEQFALPSLDKRLIYLDQLALSNLAKARDEEAPMTDEQRFWEDALQRLTHVVRLQLVACPLSIFHEEEGLVWRGYEILRAIGRSLSAELQFLDYTAVRNGQLYEHAQLWAQGRGDETSGVDADRVLEGDRHGWQPRLLIDARLPVTDDVIAELNSAREAEDVGLADVWSGWRGEDVSFETRFREEALSYGPVVLRLVAARAAAMLDPPTVAAFQLINDEAAVTLLTVRHALEDGGLAQDDSLDQAMKYLTSDSLLNVPFNRLSSLLYAALARRARSGQKGVTRGMTNDVRMISTLLPYCDAMFVDNECRTLLGENPIPGRLGYATRLFSHSNKNEFLDYLDEIEASASPEHIALVDAVYGAGYERGQFARSSARS